MFNTPESYIFALGFLMMFGFSILFFLKRKERPHYNYAFLVTSITALSYLVLIDGSLVGISKLNEPVYFTRWLFYILSCSLLMVTIAEYINSKKENLIPVIILNTLVMLTGSIAAVLYSPMKWIVFGLGSLFFIFQILLLFEKVKDNDNSKLVKNYIFFGWAIFPLIFIFAPEGLGIIDNVLAAVLYLLLDFITKIIFYIKISNKKKMPVYIYIIIGLFVLLGLWMAYGYFGSQVEQLKYTVLDSSKEYEIRQLEDHLIAETEVKGGFETATNSGFGIVAGYIFGGNKPKEKIAMTTPVVTEESEKIAMTAPVVTEEDEEFQKLYFVLPSKYTLENLPEPTDPRVKIKEVKGRKIAVLKFSGFYSDEIFEKKKEELKKYLQRDGINYGQISSAGYNPPWTPPFMNRLEVWAEIE